MASSEPIKYYDYIVVGCGGIGSGAVYWLSKLAPRGTRILGLEQYQLGHDHGGSQDHSRIIRLMYFDEMFTKLAPHTYTAWGEVEADSGIQLVFKPGSLDLARKGTVGEEALNKYKQAMTAQNIRFETLTAAQLRARFPQWTVSDDFMALYQPDGGLVDAAMGNALHVQLARGNSAEVIDNCPVKKLEPLKDGHCLVHTGQGQFRCRKVIVTAGAWINHVLAPLGVKIPVLVTQEQVSYFATPHVKKFNEKNFPVYIYHSPTGLDVYGMPIHGNTGSKIGIDAGGNAVTPETRTYKPDPVREEAVIKFLEENLPDSLGPLMYTKTCLYTMTLDRTFLIDTLHRQAAPQVIVCCGAGHAYKFASLFGKILAELALNNKTQYDIKSFSMDREAIRNPNYTPRVWMGFSEAPDWSKISKL